MNNFIFNKEKHEYLLDGKLLTGVTTVLSVIAKPALIQWAANEAVRYIKENSTPIDIYGNGENQIYEGITGNLLEEARKAHLKKKKDAGDKGTNVHAYLEGAIKMAIATKDGYLANKVEDLIVPPQAQKFFDWAVENKVKFLSCEQQVYSETHWLGGTYDFICEINGKKYVGDIKTSNAIYGREYFAQCAAYRLMCEEMGENGFSGSVVVRLGKDGSSETVFSEDYQEDKKLFLACLDVYRSMGTFGLEEVKK